MTWMIANANLARRPEYGRAYGSTTTAVTAL
jgi:hypothetical protein